MKALSYPSPVIPFAAILTRSHELFNSACSLLKLNMNTTLLNLNPTPFTHSDYYCDEMGSDLIKGMIAFQPPFSQQTIVDFKLYARQIEWQHADFVDSVTYRSVNIDVGFVDLSKTVLATSKNFAHRIYLNSGVFAEVTLTYQNHRWTTLPWTYPDFVTEPVQSFLSQCRTALASYLRSPANEPIIPIQGSS